MEMQQIFELEKSLLNLQVYLRLKKVNFPPELVPTYLQLLELPDIILKQIVILPRVEKYEIPGAIYLAKNLLLNGATFFGQWKNNWKNGRGQEYNENEKKYQMGYWKDGEFVYGHIISEDWAFNGVASNLNPLDGKMIFLNGKEYKGKFLDGKFSDENAEFKDEIEQQQYKGAFRYGKKQGKGKLITPEFEYEGDFNDDKMTGKGTKKIKANGFILQGDFIDGQLSGLGILKRKEDDYYKGEFLNGKRHGFGEMKRGGVTYIGNFIEDVLDGWVNVLKEKREYKCFFENGVEDKNKSELIK